MDINCVSQCFYQHDGKCTLNEMSQYASGITFTQSAQGAQEMDCPYFTGNFSR